MTGNELAPHSSFTVTPFHFSVDTVPPVQPSTPVIAGFSDSGVLGDHITKYRNVNFSGFSDPNVAIQLYNGQTILGGAKADATGHWSATTTTLADGNYTVTAAAFDDAGNKSVLSVNCPLTVDGTAPTGSLTSPTNGSTVTGTVNVTANPADLNGIWKVAFQVDGITKQTNTTAPWTYPWNTSSVGNGSHTLTSTITDNADNTTTTNTTTVNVQNGAATTPGAPTLIAAIAGNGQVTLTWSAPFDGGTPITGYAATASPGGFTCATSGLSCTVTGLTNGTSLLLHRHGHERRRHRRRIERALGHPDVSGDRSRRAQPALGAARQRPGDAQLGRPASDGGSPITGYTATSSPGGLTCTSAAALHRHRAHERHHLLVHRRRHERGRHGPPVERALRVTPATVPGAPDARHGRDRGNGQVDADLVGPVRRRHADHRLHRHRSPGGSPAPPAAPDSPSPGSPTAPPTRSPSPRPTRVGTGAASNALSATPTPAATVPARRPALGDARQRPASRSAGPPRSNGGSPITGYTVTASPGGLTCTSDRRPPAPSAGSPTAPPTPSPSTRPTRSAPAPPRTRSRADTRRPCPARRPAHRRPRATAGHADLDGPGSNGGSPITGYTATVQPRRRHLHHERPSAAPSPG